MYNREERLTLEKGKFFENRTSKYLFPSLKINQPRVYKTLVTGNNLLGISIGDSKYQGTTSDDYLFIHIDPRGEYQFGRYKNEDTSINKFRRELINFRERYSYIADYPQGDFHTIIFKMPSPFYKVNFIKGNYSKIYTEEELNYVIPQIIKDGKMDILNPIYQILEKDSNYKVVFEDALNNEFRSNIEIDDDVEFDLPPLLSQEILNYEENNTSR